MADVKMRFFFDIYEQGDVTIDQRGTEMFGLNDARDKAVKAARYIMMGQVAEGRCSLDGHVVVRGDAGIAFTVPFSDAVSVSDPSR